MKSRWLIGGAAVLVGFSAMAQEINPVWVQHLNGLVNVTEVNKFPILRKLGDAADKAEGDSTVEVYVGLIRYNADLYLLGVRENGINEADPGLSEDDRARATAYPDRSIFWIDARTGQSLGLALKTEIYPVPLAVQSRTHFWWSWGITDGPHGERVIYTGYKYKILRYASAGTNASGFATWSATPTEAWVEPVPGEPAPTIIPGERGTEPGESAGDGSASFRMKALRVLGHGDNLTIFAGGATWRASSHEQEFVSDDGGLTLRPVARLNDRGDGGGAKGFYALGGEPSRIVRYPGDTNRPNLKITYQAHYPGAGWGNRPDRYTRNPDALLPDGVTENSRTNRYDPDSAASGNLPAFSWEAAAKDGNCIDHTVDGVVRYDGNWVMTLDTAEGLDYVVTYAIPSWNNQFGAIKKPGWLGLHTLDGKVAIGAKNAAQLPFYETDEVVAANGATGSTYGYEGDVEVYSEGNGNALVLATFGQYGFGVYRVTGRVAPTGVVSAPESVNTTENQPIRLAARYTGGGTPLFYSWQKDDGAGNFVNIPGASGNLGKVGVNSEWSSYSVARAQVSDAGRYRLVVGNASATVASAVATVSVAVDMTPPALVSVSTLDRTVVDLRFSEPLDTNASATVDTFSYSVNSGGSGLNIAGLTILGDGRTIRLFGLEPPLGDTYTVTAENLPDLKGNISPVRLSASGVVQPYFTSDLGGDPGLSLSPVPGEIELLAGGTDFWGTADSGHFVYQEVTGDFDVRVQIQSNRKPSNRNGIMVRESTSPQSPMVTATWNPDARYGFFRRPTLAGDVGWAGVPQNWICDTTEPPNVWLRLKRSGSNFSGYYGSDGSTWTPMGTTTVTDISPTALLGLGANRGGGTGTAAGTVFINYGAVKALRLVRNDAGEVVLTWSGSGTLEAAPTILGPWSSDGLSQSNPQTLTATETRKFYRLR